MEHQVGTRDTAAEFERHRVHLTGVAYRMLGTLADAEDAVQETYLRFARTDPAELRDVRAWLTTTVARICLDELGSAHARRESYVGPWLPEPAVGDRGQHASAVEAFLAACSHGSVEELARVLDPDVVLRSDGRTRRHPPGGLAGPPLPRRAVAGRAPLYDRASLRASRWLSQHAAGLLSRLVKYRLGRTLVLGQTHGRPFRISPGYARMTVRAMATSRGFDATMKATGNRCYRSGPAIDAPVTVAFGSRDLLLLRHQSRHLGELPPGPRLGTLPGCGHVPMADNPSAVTALIIESTKASHGLRPTPASSPARFRRLSGA